MSASLEAANVALWDLPNVAGRSVHSRRAGKTVGELEALERSTYEEAFAEGREAGLAAARAETQEALCRLHTQAVHLDAALALLARPLAELDAEVEEQLTQLALTIARQLVRRELRLDPAQVIAVIRETVGLLPASARDVRVHLHPEDAAVVREKLAAPSAERAWSIIEDPVMTRGGCRVATDTAQIDARLETRISSVMGALLGEERAVAMRGEERQ